MTAKELLEPRYEVIADYPGNENKVGSILVCPKYGEDFTVDFWVSSNDKYPHLFRKMDWWEGRSVEDMPDKVMYKGDGLDTVYEISKWDMNILSGKIKGENSCVSLAMWKMPYGYIPVD